MPWHFYWMEKPVSKVMKAVIDVLKILADTVPFPNCGWEDI
jgi:hypothetical protein